MLFSHQSVQVLTVPGFTGSGPHHWLSRWELKHPEFRRVEQQDWQRPEKETWVARLDEAVQSCSLPVALIGHSLGCITIVHWAARHQGDVIGAFLVAPADVERPDAPAPIRGFAPLPAAPLPFPSRLVASSNDPHLSMERAREFAQRWGGTLIPAGPCGHFDAESGFGVWRRGEVLFAEFLRRIL